MWQGKALGAFYKINDPKTGAPATRNIFLTPQDGEPANAAVSDLMKRGVTFVVCNVALKNLAKTSRSLPGPARTRCTTSWPRASSTGAMLVPDVFVSMQRAQKRGVAYIFTDRSR